MRKSKKLYPAEEWLIKNWLGESYKLFSIEESIKSAKEKVNNYIYEQLNKTGQTSPPFNPELLFGIRKIISKQEQSLPDNFSGILQPTKGGFFVKVNSKLYSKRKRFTIAHEIGHTFFFDVSSDIPKKKFISSNSPYWVEEDYVNSIACEILLPTPFVEETFKRNNYSSSLESLSAISNLYQVSHEVISKQLIRNLKLWDCLYFQCKKNHESITPIMSSIAKGQSFQSSNWTISKNLNKGQETPPINVLLFKNILSVFATSEKIFTSQFEIKKEVYEIQTRQLYYSTDTMCEVLITKKNNDR